MTRVLVKKTASIIKELFAFDGQLEELCSLSENEGDFGMSADEMLATLQEFVSEA